MINMKSAYWISLAITVIGGLNWALYGLVGIDAVEILFGSYTPLARTFYILVGVAALVLVAISRVNVVVISPERKPERAMRTRAPRVGRRAKAAKTVA
jgi:uncharacterized membrane protein YuzA (DUF378 family)